MAERDLPHLIVPFEPISEPFQLRSRRRSQNRFEVPGGRPSHGNKLTEQLVDALRPLDDSEQAGTRITFRSFPGLNLALKSLESQARGSQPQLLAVSTVKTEDGPVQNATVYVPSGKKAFFLSRLKAYVETSSQDKTKNAALLDGIESIRRATIRELWTDPPGEFPARLDDLKWWEVWLLTGRAGALARLQMFAQENELATGQDFLGFRDRTVALIRATANQLADAQDLLDDIAELRRPRDAHSMLSEDTPFEQAEWVKDLQERLIVAGNSSPVVCILDTGIQISNPLLTDSLSANDMHTVNPTWGVEPVRSHGTEMAGLALFNTLGEALISSGPISLNHRLESVKILPHAASNAKELYGALMARAVDLPETQAPERERVFLMAVTEDSAHRAPSAGGADYFLGRPTSWSSAIDALTFGRTIDSTAPTLNLFDQDEPPRPRLFVVSAGNIRNINASDDPLDRSDLEPVEDPAQSWNAITVGAYSANDSMHQAPHGFEGYRPIAERGELSPTSRTSVLFNARRWPIKPDVVADGGNYAASPDGTSVDTPANLRLLTTRHQMDSAGPLTVTGDTSAAAAQVAAVAAEVVAAYPQFRPETVRGLVVHSAEWTDAMLRRFGANTAKAQLARLVRRYGMGVPLSARAIHSATDALTLVTESTIYPYEPGQGGATSKVREMNLHELPWPNEVLEELSDTQVSLRVTLSYFIEPNPSNRGWSGRYTYPSHGLRFAVKRPDENPDSFRRRINARASEDESKPVRLQTEGGWLLGLNHHDSPGSLHSGIWRGPAVELATKGLIAVYPVAGWWKYKKLPDQSNESVNYSLIVSIEAPGVPADLYTPVAAAISAAVETSI